MAHVSQVEKLRRAMAAARRAGSAASTAAWRARRKVEEVRELAAELARLDSGAPAKFADTETARLLAQTHELENQAYGASRQIADLAEFMGAKAEG